MNKSEVGHETAAATVLVVEDEAPIRSLVCKLLKREGYSVLEAESGEAALEIWRDHQNAVDLLLTDIMMPGELDGWELANKLRAENPRLKVLYASGYTPPLRRREQQGAVIAKPFSLAKMTEAVRHALDTEPLPLASAA